VNALLAIPMEIRLAIVFVLGTCLGCLANLGAYGLAYKPRRIGPWFRRDAKAPPRRITDWVPVVGWLSLRREAAIHGPGFWIRPLLVELLLGTGLAWLYWWEVGCLGLLPPMAGRAPVWVYTILHAQFAAHTILILFMLAASLIDLDEWTIPDAITIPGTVIGLLLAAVFPWSLLPNLETILQGMQLNAQAWQQPIPVQMPFPPDWLFLLLTSTNAWPFWCDGPYGLLLGLGCWWAWCLAVMPWTWYSRHGWRRAVALCCARVRREWKSCVCLGLGVIGSAGIVAAWHLGTWYWMGLLSALVGVAISGGIVWAVRIIGTAVLRREAMGFGDVTLLAMIGAFLGWQPCVIIFFMAPLAGLIIAVIKLVLSRERALPYGPYLCLASVVLIVCWAPIWHWTYLTFESGWDVALLGLFCLVMMPLLLMICRVVRAAFEK